MNRPIKLDKRYGWCRRKHHGVIFPRESGCIRCKEEKRRKDEGKCIARLAHGPGHQSSTYCDVIGPHKEHNCQYGSYNQTACWTGSVYKLKFTNFFDDMG